MPAQTTLQANSGTSSSTGKSTPSMDTSPGPTVGQSGGNGAAQDKLKKVSGPIGRVWNHILGQAEGRTDTGEAQVDKAMIRAYLDKRLNLAEGEYFRGAKLDGVTDNLVEKFDTNHDGKVSWPEFQEFEGQIFAMLAPGGEKAGADANAAAGAQFSKVDGSKDGKANLGEIQGANQAALPKGTDHAELVAQLGARVAIDAADKDESNKPIGQRTLSREEWTGAAKETAARK